VGLEGDEAMTASVYNNATFHELYGIFKSDGGCCAVCSIYYAIKTMEPDYIGPPPSEWSCKSTVACRDGARVSFAKIPKEQIQRYRKKED